MPYFKRKATPNPRVKLILHCAKLDGAPTYVPSVVEIHPEVWELYSEKGYCHKITHYIWKSAPPHGSA